jgi:hypothetical protein
MNSRVFSALIAVSVSAYAQEKQQPNPVDLRSAYCDAVLVEMQNRSEAFPQLRQGSQRVAADIDLLRAYLEPRLPHLEEVPLSAARSQGRADAQQMFRDANACWNACTPIAENGGRPNADSGAKAAQCVRECDKRSEALIRAGACDPVTWLPLP